MSEMKKNVARYNIDVRIYDLSRNSSNPGFGEVDVFA
jgi:hypothetical protein